MNKMDRRRNIYGALCQVHNALHGLDADRKRTVLVEALIDVCEREDIHYHSSGSADFDVRIDLRPIEERHRDRN